MLKIRIVKRLGIMVGLLFGLSLLLPAISGYAATAPNYQLKQSFPDPKDYKQVFSVLDLAFDLVGNTYVVDLALGAVIKYDSAGQYVTHWNVAASPRVVAVDVLTDQVYVAAYDDRVYVYDSNGHLLHTFGGSGGGDGYFNWVKDIVIDDTYIYIADHNNHRVQIFNKTDRSFVTKFGGIGTGDGQFQNPAGLAISSQKHIYVSDATNSRIQLFHFDNASSTWSYHSQFGTYGTTTGTFDTPQSLYLRENTGGSGYDFLFAFDTRLTKITRMEVHGDDLSMAVVADAHVRTLDQELFSSYNHARMVFNPHKDALYVTNSRMIADAMDLENTTRWIGYSADQFNYAGDVTADRAGNIYVADMYHHRILKYDVTGNFMNSWGGYGGADGELIQPLAVAVDSNDDVYVGDTYNHRIQKFNADGNFIGKWGESGLEDGKLLAIQDIAVDAYDDVYVITGKVMQKFTADGRWLMTIGNQLCNHAGEPACTDSGFFENPGGVAVDADGYIYVTDRGQNVINKFASDGSFVMRWGEMGSDPGKLYYPTSLAIDDLGRIYVLDRYNYRIQVFAADGSFISEFAQFPETLSITGLDMDQANQLYVIDGGAYHIKIYEDVAIGPPPVLPVPLADLSAVGGDGSVTLTFSAPTDATSVTVKQSVAGSGVWTDAAMADPMTATSTGAVVTGLADDTTYEFYLEVVGGDHAGNSNMATATTNAATVVDSVPPVWPGGSELILSDMTQSSIKLSWPEAQDNFAVTGYRIFVDDSLEVDKASGDFSYSVTENVYSYTMTELSPNTTYRFTVKAYDAKNNESEPGLSGVATTMRSSGDVWYPSDNANLKLLEIWTDHELITLTPEFEPEITEYTAETTVRQVELKATADYHRAKIVWQEQQMGDTPIQLDLQEGDNVIKLVVQAESHSSKIYTLTIVYQAPESNEPDASYSGTNESDADDSVALFSDTAGHWAESYIRDAIFKGLVHGYMDGTFKPDHPVTRAEFAVMLVRFLQLDGEAEELAFTDHEKIGAWAKREIALAAQARIIEGYTDGSFRPDKAITRTEIAVMAARALRLSWEAHEETRFADDNEIPQWAKGAVEAIRKPGIIEGRGENHFMPHETATRAEATVILLRVVEKVGM